MKPKKTKPSEEAPRYACHSELWPLESLTPYEKNPRKNDTAVAAIAKSIQEFGFRQPIVVDREGVIVVGHTRYKAAKKLGLTHVPVHVAADLTPAQARAYRLADNRSGEISSWDTDALQVELMALKMEGFDWDNLGLPSFAQVAAAVDKGDPPEVYSEQYGVIVMCKDAAHQEQIYNELTAAGHKVKVVTT